MKYAIIERFAAYRGTTKALIIWTALAVVWLAVRLPTEHWTDQCARLGPGVTECAKANAPPTLVYTIILWFVGVAIILLIRYVPLPTAKR